MPICSLINYAIPSFYVMRCSAPISISPSLALAFHFLLLHFIALNICIALPQTVPSRQPFLSEMPRHQNASHGLVQKAKRRAPPRAHSLAFIWQQSKGTLSKYPLKLPVVSSSAVDALPVVRPPPPHPTLFHSSPPRPTLPSLAVPVPSAASLPPSLSPSNLSPPPPPAKCLLPSDFWCDHPQIEQLCTGSVGFCAAYKTSQRSRGIELKLAFESGCPDSQKLIVHRLFPRVLSDPDLSGMVDFKAIPYGLAKRRQHDHQIQCHHGPKECSGNRLLSCALKHPYSDRLSRARLLNCFMAKMMEGSEPESGMVGCLANSAISASEILHCARSNAATQIQFEDETETAQILNSPPFVPFLALNGWNHMELQAPAQLLLAEKLAHWNETLNGLYISKRSVLRPQLTARGCELPPDFWCSSDASVTDACFDEQKCQSFHRSLYGIPVHLKVIYNSQLFASRDYLRRYLRPQFFSGSGAPRYAQNVGKVWVELEPAAMAQRECIGTTTAQCQQRILETCVFAAFTNVVERSAQLICINDMESKWRTTRRGSDDQIHWAWQRNCQPTPVQRVRQTLLCTSTEPIWRQANARLGSAQLGTLWPEQRRTDPWVVLNGLSLSSVQRYSRVLDQLVCLWYRGPGHDSKQCGRCEYEPTHC